jgi:hypothetical protein
MTSKKEKKNSDNMNESTGRKMKPETFTSSKEVRYS